MEGHPILRNLERSFSDALVMGFVLAALRRNHSNAGTRAGNAGHPLRTPSSVRYRLYD